MATKKIQLIQPSTKDFLNPATTTDIVYNSSSTTTIDTEFSTGSISATNSIKKGGVEVALSTDLNSKVDKVSSTTDNAIVRFNGTNGAIQNSVVTVADSGSITIGGTWTDTSANNPRLSMGGYAYMTANNSGAFSFAPNGTPTFLMTTTEIRPISNTAGSVDLGSAAYKFRNIYATNSIYATKLNNGANITIPTSGGTLALTDDINNATLTIKANGTSKGTFTANASSDVEIDITASDLGLSSAMKFIGTTTTSISDGATTNPITIGGNSVTATSGNVTLYNHKEFLWNGSAWEELGDESSYALKSITITGTGVLGGGGTLESNRTITHNAGNAASKTSGFYKFSTDAYSHIASVTAVSKSDITGLVTSMSAASGGTDLSLVTTGEKYNWNQKWTNNSTTLLLHNSNGSGSISVAGADSATSTSTTYLQMPLGSDSASAPLTLATQEYVDSNTPQILRFI